MLRAKRNPRANLSPESGLALLLAIFTLMLLSAIGLALLGAADLETKIASNYRDKQASIYASLAGLQEARDRLIPARCPKDGSSSCADPTAIDTRNLQLPTPTTPGVIYIVNPDASAGESASSLRPWSPTTAGGDPNPYFDSDLCSSDYMDAKLCTGGLPPTTNAWYKVYDDTQSYAGAYRSGVSTGILNPLPYKWVRITLKADDITPIPATTSPSHSQMCWDGANQLVAASGYDNTCTTDGGIILFDGTSTCVTCTFSPPKGSGYVSPVVTIDSPGGGGTQATATANVTSSPSDSLAYVSLTSPGSGYTSLPTVTISPPASGTTATAKVSYLPVGAKTVTGFSAVSNTTPIGCYSSAPAVAVNGGGGSGATATAIVTGQTCIVSWSLSLTEKCDSEKGNTFAVGASGGSGSGFTGSVKISNGGTSISSYSITDPGSGYTGLPTAVTSSTACKFSATWTLGHQVQSLALGSGGSGYTSTPTVSIAAPTAPAGQTPPTASAIMSGVVPGEGTVTAITLTNAGSGYSVAPTVTISGGGASTNATATAVLGSTGKIDSITLTNAGSGYTTTPSVTITDGGGGTGATIKAKLNKQTGYGKVYVLTALSVNKGGSKSLAQMEASTAPAFPVTMPGALVLDSPIKPAIGLANSNIYTIDGNDKNSCGETKQPPKVALGIHDDPYNPNSPTSTECITSQVGGTQIAACPQQPGTKPGNYTGVGATPDVENVYSSLGVLTTVAGVDSLATTIASNADYVYNPPPGTPQTSIYLGDMTTTPPDCPTTVVNGDLTLFAKSGCGVLLVTGKLTMQGNYDWYGPVFVIGTKGDFLGGGGGEGTIHGSLFLAQTKDPATGNYLTTLGDVSYKIQGGGGNNIWYDHCWADNMINVLGDPLKSPHPLRALSIRTVY